ncbi:hypothetical protein BDZ91DRAFT_330687 [Kalaharituber pfeilii]|nr:hypothetical protein BDZ91DRAFT_330687 [Kalaharituber pfeilii]
MTSFSVRTLPLSPCLPLEAVILASVKRIISQCKPGCKLLKVAGGINRYNGQLVSVVVGWRSSWDWPASALFQAACTFLRVYTSVLVAFNNREMIEWMVAKAIRGGAYRIPKHPTSNGGMKPVGCGGTISYECYALMRNWTATSSGGSGGCRGRCPPQKLSNPNSSSIYPGSIPLSPALNTILILF